MKCNAHDGELMKCFVAYRKCGKTATVAPMGATVEVAVKCWRGPHILSAVLSRMTPTSQIISELCQRSSMCFIITGNVTKFKDKM